jgi:hypothetical protein
MHAYILFALDPPRERPASAGERAYQEWRHANPRSSIRRSVGRRFIELGHRIAAEPSLELARSR